MAPRINLIQLAPGQWRIDHNLDKPWMLVGILIDIAKNQAIRAMQERDGGQDSGILLANALPGIPVKPR